MTDSCNLIDLASEITEDNNIISPLVPSPTIKLYVDKNNPFDIVADEVDCKNANADDPFEICFDDANNGEDIFQNDISHINYDISFDNNSNSPIKEEYKNIFESSRIQNHLIELDDCKIKRNIKENGINRSQNDKSFESLKNSSNNEHNEQIRDSYKNTNLLELDNLQASLLDLQEIDSLKISDNVSSQDEESLLNKLQINDNSGSHKTLSNENSLADKIDFLNTSVDDLKALVAKRIDKCIKSGLNESKTNLNFSNIETRKDSSSPPVRSLNRAFSESSCLNRLNTSQAISSKEKDISEFTHHFKSKKALSDLTRDLISLKNFRRSSTSSAHLSNSFTHTKEHAKTNSFFADPTSTPSGKICDEEEPEWLSNSFEYTQNENITKNEEKKSPKYSINHKKINDKENKIELKTRYGENDIVIIVTPSCKSNSKNLQESLVPHVTETLNSYFGKNDIKSQENNSSCYMAAGKSNSNKNLKEEKQLYDTPASMAPGKSQNRLVRFKKNIVNSLNRGPLKATMPVQQMAKECINQEDKSLSTNYPSTPITKKDSNLKPKATSTPLSSLTPRVLTSQSFNKKSIKPSAKGPVSKVFNRSLTESSVSPSVPLLRRSNSMTSPQKVPDLYRSKKANISKNTKQSSPSTKNPPKSTSPLQPKQNLMKSQSNNVTRKMETKKIFGKPILKLKKNVIKIEKENKCK